ncbi:MAG: hypothetical protein P1U89_09865 [Verrucomicrobiales bacterium]|nr:hypothetical protein [Verrucomicrobiales bacterium]
MKVLFFGKDLNKLELCEVSARHAGLPCESFPTFREALEQRSETEAIVIASENVLVNQIPDLNFDRQIVNPGNQASPCLDLCLIGKQATIPNQAGSIRDLNRQRGSLHYHYRPSLLAAFDPSPALDYDFSRYRSIPAFISFTKVPNEWGRRAGAMAEMLQLLKSEPYDFTAFVEKTIVRQLSPRLRDGERFTPSRNATFGVERIVAVCDSGFDDDLWRLIPTAAGFHPDIEIHLFCDVASAATAKRVIQSMIPSGKNVVIRPEITPESIKRIENRFRGINQSNYWKPGPIWWKLEALRSVLEEDSIPTLLVDCDIIFASAVKDTFQGVDLVMSPFFWPNPNLKVPVSPGSEKYVSIAERDGWYNAGYLLATRIEVAETWMELYEQSVGNFYEQFCMGYLPQRFRHDVFGSAHNWGQWRCESPPENVISVHAHRRTNHNNPFGNSIQVVAEESAEQFLK